MADEFRFVVRATDLASPALRGLVASVSKSASAMASAFAAPFRFMTSPRWFGFQAFKQELSGLVGEFKRFYDMGKEDIEAGVGFQKMLGLGADAANQWAVAIKRAAGGTIELSEAMKMGSRASAYGVTLRQLVPIMDYVRKFAKATGNDWQEMMDGILLPGPRRAMALRRAGLMPAGAKATDISMSEVAAMAARKSQSFDLSGLPPSLARINAAWSDMVSSIATAVASSKSLHQIVEGLGKFMEAAGRYADRMGPKITAAIDNAIPYVKDAFLKLGEYIIDIFTVVAAEINKLLGGNWRGAKRWLDNPGRMAFMGRSTGEIQEDMRAMLGLGPGPVGAGKLNKQLAKFGKGDNQGLFGVIDADAIKAKLRNIGQAIVEEMNAPAGLPREGIAERLFGNVHQYFARLKGSAQEFGAKGFEWVERMTKAAKMIADAFKGPIDALREAQAGLKASQANWRGVRLAGEVSEFAWQVNTLPEGSYQRWEVQRRQLNRMMNRIQFGGLDAETKRAMIDQANALGGQGSELYRFGNANFRRELFDLQKRRNVEGDLLARAEVAGKREAEQAAKDALNATRDLTSGLLKLANEGLGEFASKMSKAKDALPGEEAVAAAAAGGQG